LPAQFDAYYAGTSPITRQSGKKKIVLALPVRPLR
jgi:hypothetical protein